MNEKSKENIKKAHIYCRTNRKILTKSSRCGCFYWLKIFEPKEIKDWCDNGTTAICPYCGIDSLLPENNFYPLTLEFLAAMKKYWFF